MQTERNCPSWRIPDGLWRRMEPFLPKYRRSPLGGRPRLELRKVMNGIFYVLRTGCQWKAAPAEFGSGSSLHRYFQEFARRGLFHKVWKYLLRRYDQLRGIQWKWQSLDGSMTKAPLGGEKNREKPHRSRQTGGEAVGVDRRSRRPVGCRHRWGQCA
jgi:transposase